MKSREELLKIERAKQRVDHIDEEADFGDMGHIGPSDQDLAAQLESEDQANRIKAEPDPEPVSYLMEAAIRHESKKNFLVAHRLLLFGTDPGEIAWFYTHGDKEIMCAFHEMGGALQTISERNIIANKEGK